MANYSNLYINVNATSPRSALVRSVTNATPMAMGDLVYGDTQYFRIYLTDGKGSVDAASGNGNYGLKMAIGPYGLTPVCLQSDWTATSVTTPTSGSCWEGYLSLYTTELYNLISGSEYITSTFECQLTEISTDRPRTLLQVPITIKNEVISSGTGSVVDLSSLSVNSASYALSASYAYNSTTASYALNAPVGETVSAAFASNAGLLDTFVKTSFLYTSSFTSYTGSNTSTFAGTSSYCTTASYVKNADWTGKTDKIVPVFSGSANPVLIDSVIYNSGSMVAINTTSPTSNLHVVGDIYATTNITGSKIKLATGTRAQCLVGNYLYVGQTATGVGSLSYGAEPSASTYLCQTTHNSVFGVGSGSAFLAMNSGSSVGTGFTPTNRLAFTLDSSNMAGMTLTGVQAINTTPDSTTNLNLGAATTTRSALRINSGSNVASPTAGDLWMDPSMKLLRGLFEGVNSVWIPITTFKQTSTVTRNGGTAGAQSLLSGVGAASIPVNFFNTAGKSLRVQAWGYHTLNSTANSITFKLNLGGTTILTSGAITDDNHTGNMWKFDGIITCRTAGESGTVFGQGDLSVFGGETTTDGSTYYRISEMCNTSTVTVNTEITYSVDLTAEFTSTDTGDSVSCTNAYISVF